MTDKLQADDSPSSPKLNNAASATNTGMAARVVRGGLWNLGGQGCTMLASLVATPFVIRLLGSEAYGVLALINVLIGYLAFADLGMGAASTRFGAEAYARSDAGEENAVIWTSLLVSVGPALLAALLLTLLARLLVVQALKLPEHLHGEAILALRLAALGFVARVIAGVMNTPQLVRLRNDSNTAITLGSGVLQICLAPVVLLLGGRLVSIVLLASSASILAALLHIVVSRRFLPALLRPKIKSDLIGPLARFGSGVVVSCSVVLILVNAEKILIARFASVTVLAHYSVAYTLATMLMAMPVAIGQLLIPAFARPQSDADALNRLYVHAVRGLLLWMAPAAAVVVASAGPCLTFWVGPEYGRESVAALYILVVGVFFNAPSYVAGGLLMAWGKPGLIARFHLAELFPYLLCMAALTYWKCAVGAALDWSLRIAIDTALLFWAVKRNSLIPLAMLSTNWPGYAAALLLLIVAVLLTLKLALLPVLQISIGLVSLAAYAVIAWGWVLKDDERSWIKRLVPLRWPAPAGRA
jgi:O-antigen/teichoic acid export membrane protein